MPISQACKLPILVYGRCACLYLNGQINIVGKVYKGCITIGLKRDNIRSYKERTIISNAGLMILHSGCWFNGGVKLSTGESGILEVGKNSMIGDNTTIICAHSIKIGNNCNVGYNNMFMDTDFHYMVNLNTRECHNNVSSIVIGDNNWITNNITVKKGTKTPMGTITAGPFSTLTKDYREIIPAYSIIAGSPAKLIKSGFRRVKNIDSEIALCNYYRDHDDLYIIEPSMDIDKFCLPQN